MPIPMMVDDDGMIELTIRFRKGDKPVVSNPVVIDPVKWTQEVNNICQRSADNPEILNQELQTFVASHGFKIMNGDGKEEPVPVSIYFMMNLQKKLDAYVKELKKKDGWETTPSETPSLQDSTDAT